MSYSSFFTFTLFSILAFSSVHPEYHSMQTTMYWSNQGNNKSFKEPKSDHSYGHNDTWNNSRAGSGYSHHYHFDRYNTQEFREHFTQRGYTEKEILNQRCLYMFDEFVKFAQTYSSYKCTIQQLHAELKKLNIVQKIYYMAKGTYCSGLQKRIHYLYNQLSTLKNEAPACKEPIIREHSFATFPQHHAEYKALGDIYHAHIPSLSNAIEKRIDAFNDMTKGDYALQYVSKSYNLNNDVKQLLNKYGYDTTRFTQCYGHQLHQAIHQESLDLLDHIDSLPATSLLYDHQEALIDFTVAMTDYNHEGITDKAMNIADFCWTLLDYGQAIAEGAALGAYTAVTDLVHHPIEATINIVAGKQVLMYQLSKVLYNVADIGVTALSNFDHAKDKWNKYAEPLNNIIDAINKKKITVRDVLKGGTAFVVGYKVQGKLLGGLGKFCNTIKQKSINFVKNNSLLNPQEYLTTPEGLLFKATTKSTAAPKQITNPEEYLLHNIPNTQCPASCPNQYNHLKQLLRIKEFTSILKLSRHGIERLIEREFTPTEALAVIKHPSYTKLQYDGSIAYIKQIQNRFNVIVLSEETVVTAFKNFDQKALNNLGKNYGWK